MSDPLTSLVETTSQNALGQGSSRQGQCFYLIIRNISRTINLQQPVRDLPRTKLIGLISNGTLTNIGVIFGGVWKRIFKFTQAASQNKVNMISRELRMPIYLIWIGYLIKNSKKIGYQKKEINIRFRNWIRLGLRNCLYLVLNKYLIYNALTF